MSDRKAEMERKRARLLALRQEQQLRREARERQDAAEAASRCAADLRSRKGQQLAAVDDILSLPGQEPRAVLTELTSLGPLPGDEGGGRREARRPVLSTQTLAVVSFPPLATIVYAKHTQTTTEVRDDSDEEPAGVTTADSGDESTTEDIKQEPLEPKIKDSTLVANSKDIDKLPTIQPLTVKEQAKIVASNEFRAFFGRTTKLVERALAEEVDIFKDYTQDVTSTMDDAHKTRHQLLTLDRNFSCTGQTSGSIVTSLDWCAEHPELVLASYSLDQAQANMEEGLCLTWNMMFKKETPEHVFKCSSKVVSSKFVVYHPHLVLGGTYSGQIVLWDTRESRRLPVLQSMLWSRAHTQPVYSMNMIGGKHSHHLVSASSDSRVCVWSLDMLTKPQQIIDLSVRGGAAVAPTCMDFPNDETNNFVIGAEEGSIYYASLRGERPGVTHQFSGHAAPVSGISARSVGESGVRPTNVYLTSSFDWSVKLWSAGAGGAEPVHTFAHYADAVYDVKWSPAHPGVFAVADGDGRLEIWNLCDPNFDCLNVPVATAVVTGAPSLNKVAWAKTGMQVAVGDDHGRVWVYSVGDRLTKPTDADWTAIMKTFSLQTPQSQELKMIVKGIAKLETHVRKDGTSLR